MNKHASKAKILKSRAASPGKINIIEASPFLVASLIGLGLAGMFYVNVQEEKAS